MNVFRASVLALSVASGGLLVGCGGPDGPELGLVTGLVTNSGVPVKNSLVEFYPQKGRPSMGRTNDQGKYELQFNENDKGAMVGLHEIRVTPGSMVATQAGTDAAPAPPLPKPKKGEDVVKMPGTVEVKSGDNVFDLELTKIKS
jgi:hypothetical protein